jgi:hypothetical protein
LAHDFKGFSSWLLARPQELRQSIRQTRVVAEDLLQKARVGHSTVGIKYNLQRHGPLGLTSSS